MGEAPRGWGFGMGPTFSFFTAKKGYPIFESRAVTRNWSFSCIVWLPVFGFPNKCQDQFVGVLQGLDFCGNAPFNANKSLGRNRMAAVILRPPVPTNQTARQ